MAQFHKLSVKSIERQTADAVSISFNVPDALQEDFQFKAGQYITLKTFINGKEVRRDYSLCVTPGSNELTVAVKEVEDGVFSTFANRSLQVGDELEVGLPNGRFVFEPDASKTRTIAAFAAGSGITPVISIVKTLLEEEPNSSAVLVYGNKTPEDTIFYNELQLLQSNYSGRFYLVNVYSRSDVEGALFGRIEKSTINYALKNKFKDLNIECYYLCGPEAMINTTTNVLLENGVDKEAIRFELFTASTQSLDEDQLDIPEGTTQITVLVDDEETTFVMPQQKTILEAALAQNIDAPYSCQGGVCSSCIAKLTEGEASMRQNNILTDSELAEGLILTCQAHPTTTKVVVDYDDV